MSRWKLKKKRWHDLKSKRIKYRKHNKYNLKYNREVIRYVKNGSEILLNVPDEFSFIKNTDKTIFFFKEFDSQIKNAASKTKFFIESKNVNFVTVDALIYIIALLRNNIINLSKHYSFAGNFPLDKNAKKVYIESGFMSYVKSKLKQLPQNSDKLMIKSGKENNQKIAKECCEFVIKTLGKSRADMSPLYRILIELMSNVYHHAYNEDNSQHKKWYIYAEKLSDCVKFVFVDTGAGIANTVRKNWTEKIQTIVGSIKDSNLLYSAFQGDFRTKTNQYNRGNGLPNVMNSAKKDIFRNFDVISGKGKCSLKGELNNLPNANKEEFKYSLNGTIYTFDIY